MSFLIQRMSPAGAASFRLDVSVAANGPVEGLLADFAIGFDRKGRASGVLPGEVQNFNGDREPTAYSEGRRGGTCTATVSVCDTGSTPAGALTVIADDSGPSATPTVVVIAHGTRITWTFEGHGYSLRETTTHYRYISGSAGSGTGVDYLGNGVEADVKGQSLAGGPRGSVAIGLAPCSTTGSGVVSRGAGQVTLLGGAKRPTSGCPQQRGVVADTNWRATTWTLQGTVIGDSTMRGVRLLVVDLPFR